MRRVVVIAFFLSTLTLHLAEAWAVPPAYPRIQAASLYTGQGSIKGKAFHVELRLLNRNWFILRQDISLRGGRRETRFLTGLWRQRGDGSFLELSNRNGFQLPLNVGGAGNLYGDFSRLGADAATITLRTAPFQLDAFRIMGTFVRHGSDAILTDCSTGRIFTVQAEAGLEELPDGEPIFAEIEAVPASDGLHMTRMLAHSRHFPTGAEERVPVSFAAAVGDIVWRLQTPGLPDSSWRFSGGDAGLVEASAPGLRLEAGYRATYSALEFHLDTAGIRDLEACDAAMLADILSEVRSWSLNGDELILSTPDGRTLSLERPEAVRQPGIF